MQNCKQQQENGTHNLYIKKLELIFLPHLGQKDYDASRDSKVPKGGTHFQKADVSDIYVKNITSVPTANSGKNGSSKARLQSLCGKIFT